jgi:hypothetical protein
MSESNPQLARYIFSGSQFAATTGVVKYGAFLPPPNKRLSVFDIERLDDHAIWEMGKSQVARERSIKARADLLSDSVTSEGLSIAPDENPTSRHRNITGWDNDSSKNLIIASNLSKKAKLIVLPKDQVANT